MLVTGHGPIHPPGSIYLSAQAQQPPPHGHPPNPFVPPPPEHQSQPPPQQHLSVYHHARPASPEKSKGVPCLQVTQPTPTKGRKYRTASEGDAGGSTSGDSLYMASPTWQTGPMLPSPGSAGGSLDVSVEPLQRYAGPSVRSSRPRSPDVEQLREVGDEDKEAKRKQRAREMGRERQRRKRERDRKAKEEAMKGKSQSQSDATSGRRTSNASYTSSQNSLSITVPSPASAYSPLGTGSSYFSISPSGHQLGQISGQSSPGAFFSPAVSTPGSYLESNSANYWGEGSAGGLDLSANKPPSRPGRTSRVSSGNVPTSATLKISSSTGLPIPPDSNTTPQPPTVGPAPPNKRRKSEPKPDTFRSTRENSFGRVQSLAALERAKDDRPRLQRTSSDGAVLRRLDTKEKSRSLTPPPVPLLPEQFRQSTLSMSDTCELTGASSEGQYFASFVVHEAARSNSEEAVLMRERLGLGIEEMSGMRENIAMAYDKWKLERGMSKISLGSDSIPPSTAASASQSPRGSRASLPDPNIFTPVSNMPVRYARVPNTLPMSSTYGQHQPQDSPLTSTAHGRGRSLSSLSMTAVIESAQWGVPDTPGAVSAGAMAKDDTGSPNTSTIHTPSTGQGAFPLLESNNLPPKALWSEPIGGRMYHAYHNAPGVQSMQGRDEFNQPFVFGGEGQLLDSPLSMTGQVEGMRINMPPPPPTAGGAHPSRQSSMSAPGTASEKPSSARRHERHASVSVVSSREGGHFRTPSGPRSAGLRKIQAPQFTPPTPLSARGSSNIQAQQNAVPGQGYAAEEQMDGMLFYTGVFGTAPQSSQPRQETSGSIKEALSQQQQQESFSFMPSQPYPAHPVGQGSFQNQTSQPLPSFSSQQSENQ
ncbi:hypothetical protein IAR50_000678 [Cryptococcus sp. DSM 104548]